MQAWYWQSPEMVSQKADWHYRYSNVGQFCLLWEPFDSRDSSKEEKETLI